MIAELLFIPSPLAGEGWVREDNQDDPGVICETVDTYR